MLPVEKVKEAIISPDRELREAAVYYFARSHSDDRSLMPLVMQAFERFGDTAFEMFTFLEDLVQTSESVAWLCRQIEQVDPDAEEEASSFFTACVAALRHADSAALKPHEAAIAGLEHLDDESKTIVADRIHVSSFTSEALWAEIEEFCKAQDQEEEAEDHDLEFGWAIADAVARFPDECRGRVLDTLRQKGEDWLELLAVRMAGRLRLNEAASCLIDLLTEWDTWAYQEALNSLARIGTDSVVEQLAARYVTADNDLRLAIACILENIHTDRSVRKCLELLDQEQDAIARGFLIQSILMSFSPEGIEPARHHVLTTPKTPEVLEVRQDLLVACKMLGMSFPEFEQWQEDAKTDPEFRREWYKLHPLVQDDNSFEDDEPSADDDFDEGFVDERPAPIVRHDEKIGRNDPCPCGSGKKYKKCCYGKGRVVEESDQADSEAMSSVPLRKSPQTFPIGTVALYGPDESTTTKIVAGVIKREGADAILQRWVGKNINENPKVKRQMQAFFERHNVKNVVASDGNMGCPHEEDQDYPHGEDCPFCPFWVGKQGSNRRDQNRRFQGLWGSGIVTTPESALPSDQTISLFIDRLKQIEQRLDRIETDLPSVAAFSEAISRLANHFAPEPANIVGSRYVADRLGCTTAWVGRMAFKGIIPRGCVVPGTGKGRLWKFYRGRIDDWMASGASPG